MGALVTKFTTLIVGLAGFATAFTMVVVVVAAAGVVFVVVLLDEIRLVVFTELVWVLLLAIEIEPPPDPKEPLPEFDANAITGAAPIVSDAVETIELEKLGAVATGIITGVIDVAVV